MKFILLLFILLLLKVTDAYNQDISGYWQGVSYQFVGGIGPYYPTSVQLFQNGHSVIGYLTSKLLNSNAYVTVSLEGTIKNDTFHYVIIKIVSQIPPPYPHYWCNNGYGDLVFDSVAQTLMGPTNSPGCAGEGKAEYWRLKILSDSIFCEDEFVQIRISGQNIKWYSDSLMKNLVDTGNIFSPKLSSTTTYFVTQTHYNTQSPAYPIKIVVKQKSSSVVNTSICEGQTYLGHNTTGTFTDTFTSVNGCDSIRILNLSVRQKSFLTTNQRICEGQVYLGYNKSGVYMDTFMAANGCDSIRTLNLTVIPKLYSTISKIICQGQTYLGYNVSGIYTDTFTSTIGCDSIRTLNLTVNKKLYSNIIQEICEGQTYLGYNASGVYTDTLTSANGCDSIRTLDLTVVSKPKPYLGLDRNLCRGDTIKLFPGKFESYLWQDGSINDSFIVKQSGIYSVTVSNTCGSKSADVFITETVCNVQFPSAFTPNNDGKNDVFTIKNGYDIEQYRLIIFNRFGQKVFETNDYTKGWDGSFKGQSSAAGVYVWCCNYKINNQNRYLKGTVTLLR